MARQRRKFDDEFKRNAVQLMRSRGTKTVAQVAADLGVTANSLFTWAGQFEKTAAAKRNTQGETLEEENLRLRKQVERLELEKTILKKAAAFFAKETE
jgi:transposase